MRSNIITIEDFYSDPMEVRQFALEQNFDVDGNFPGHRTVSHATEGMKQSIGLAVEGIAGPITDFRLSDEPWESNYNGAFQYTTCYDRTWIHHDGVTQWAAVIYLTPDAPLSGGTGLFRHKSTGLSEAVDDKEVMGQIDLDANDRTKWDLCDVVANKFNRMVLYRGSMFHASLDYFGQDKEDGRLFQTFFFDTEHS